MKTVRWRKSFSKDFNKLQRWQKTAWTMVFKLFIENQNHSKLRRHKLSGKYRGLESVDVAPDLRALFLETEDEFVFYFLRNHNQLYS
ncbi:MAG: type II toxin-antitoxin system YafQ family toxin [Candidatus Magasanikbacteria bacterium]|nr:type II toxin-antitoxin system YafQ family toxin [Candidatus Magasanikbacteria bacterium]